MQLLPRKMPTADYLAQADRLATEFAQITVERDKAAGTPKSEVVAASIMKANQET